MRVHTLILLDLDAEKHIAARRIQEHRGTCWDLWANVNALKGPADVPDFYEDVKPCDLCREYIHALREKKGLSKTETPW